MSCLCNYHFNLPSLQSFQTGYQSFFVTISISLSSNTGMNYWYLHLPNLQSLETGSQSFYQSASLSLSSNTENTIYYSIFLNYNHLIWVKAHSMKLEIWHSQVMILILEWNERYSKLEERWWFGNLWLSLSWKDCSEGEFIKEYEFIEDLQ